MRSLIFFFAVLLPSALWAQYGPIDGKAVKWPDSATVSVEGMGNYVNGHFSTPLEKTRAIFIWIASNIQYDIDNMFAINFYEDPAEKIAKPLRTHKGICENYAALFAAVCKQAGIRAVVIEGYTKQRGFTDYIPHAWCAAEIDGQWWLFDPTWGSGYIGQGKFVKHLNEAYFKAAPGVFIKDHMPFDYLWQFLYYPVTNQEFYEGKTAEDKTRPYFSYPDSIRVYESLPPMAQEAASAVRVEKNGLRNGMIFDWLRHLKLDVENDRQNTLVDTYNAAMADYNDGVKQFNVYINYYNQQFKPARPDAEIQQMLDTVSHRLQAAQMKMGGMVLTSADTRIQQPMQQLKQSIGELETHVKELQDWLAKYFSKGKMGRKSMFYKLTWFGAPVN